MLRKSVGMLMYAKQRKKNNDILNIGINYTTSSGRYGNADNFRCHVPSLITSAMHGIARFTSRRDQVHLPNFNYSVQSSVI